ncbi:hypothetical protein AVEN_270687-1 [Araneus ventricosus]|uniref:Uncharacterized protein n=1 Tax=Araneus ventricosus TaxID=182803 RepID=A0A4Y2FY70_ARAVE|nr:hypothetical protein AVEN_270687-1 [Araneus ventricosus]
MAITDTIASDPASMIHSICLLHPGHSSLSLIPIRSPGGREYGSITKSKVGRRKMEIVEEDGDQSASRELEEGMLEDMRGSVGSLWKGGFTF